MSREKNCGNCGNGVEVPMAFDLVECHGAPPGVVVTQQDITSIFPPSMKTNWCAAWCEKTADKTGANTGKEPPKPQIIIGGKND